jgi:hypothetical protein
MAAQLPQPPVFLCCYVTGSACCQDNCYSRQAAVLALKVCERLKDPARLVCSEVGETATRLATNSDTVVSTTDYQRTVQTSVVASGPANFGKLVMMGSNPRPGNACAKPWTLTHWPSLVRVHLDRLTSLNENVKINIIPTATTTAQSLLVTARPTIARLVPLQFQAVLVPVRHIYAASPHMHTHQNITCQSTSCSACDTCLPSCP